MSPVNGRRHRAAADGGAGVHDRLARKRDRVVGATSPIVLPGLGLLLALLAIYVVGFFVTTFVGR